MSNQLTGKIIVKNDTQTFPSGFQKREFVIEEIEGKYPQQIKFEVVKDKCDALDSVAIGSVLTVDYNLRGNEYQGKYYVSLQAWKFNVDAVGFPDQAAPKQEGVVKSQSDGWDDDPDEDIPF